MEFRQHYQISEVDLEGHVLRSYGGRRGGGERQLNRLNHMAIDWCGRLIVTDSSNKRVVLLSVDLEFERTIMSSSIPLRCCYNQQIKQLIVGLDVGGGKSQLVTLAV